MNQKKYHNHQVLIVAECNVNLSVWVMYILCTLVLIVAECNVNKNDKFLQKSEHYVLIVAECNVNISFK